MYVHHRKYDHFADAEKVFSEPLHPWLHENLIHKSVSSVAEEIVVSLLRLMLRKGMITKDELCDELRLDTASVLAINDEWKWKETTT